MRLNLALGHVSVAAADSPTAAARVLGGIVAPFGQYGSTSAGRFRIAPGALTWPEDLRRVKLFNGHDRDHPIAFAAGVEETADGIGMRFQVTTTADGDAALVEAAEGIRDAFSVELDDVEFDGDTITAGRIIGVALVPLPAYADARVTMIAAQDTAPAAGDGDDQGDVDDEDGDDQGEDGDGGEGTEVVVNAARRPAALTAARRPAAPARRSSTMTVARAAQIIAAYNANPADPALSAALADITYSSASSTVSPPGWLGELWEGVRYQRIVIPLISSATLTNFRMTGWRWSTRPKGGHYAGDKAQIPSNPAVVEAVPLSAERWAGGNDIDRAYFDFNDTEFLDSYSREMADSYAQDTDDAALTALVDGSVDVAAADITAGLIAGALEMNAARMRPTSVLLSTDLLEDWGAMTEQNTPPMLTALLGSPTLENLLGITHPDLPTQTMLMISKPGAEFRELGGSPLRFDALELARGGVDRAFFGYHKTWVRKPGGVVAVTVGTVVP